MYKNLTRVRAYHSTLSDPIIQPYLLSLNDIPYVAINIVLLYIPFHICLLFIHFYLSQFITFIKYLMASNVFATTNNKTLNILNTFQAQGFMLEMKVSYVR